jgi:hypothetical protein
MVCGAGILLVAVARGAGAQGVPLVRGRVVDAVTQAPVASALVELRNRSGASIITGIASSSGAFQLVAPTTGTYVLRVIAIGYRPRPLQDITVPADGLPLGDLVLNPVEFRLRDLVALGPAKSCGRKRVLADDLLGRLLSNARNALDVMSRSVGTHQVSFTAMSVASNIQPGQSTADTVQQLLTRWPLESIDERTLQTHGFGEVGGNLLKTLYGPDPQTLFSEWFMDSHCFALQPVKTATDTLRIAFTPAAKSSRIDVSGELDLDPRTFALLRLAFQGENLPHSVDRHAAGGEIHFTPLPSGLWLPASWTIWAPIQGTSTCDWRVIGLSERRGAVLTVVAPSARGDTTISIPLPGDLLPRQTRFDHEKCLARPSFLDGGGGGAIH